MYIYIYYMLHVLQHVFDSVCHHWGLEKLWGAVQHARRCGISPRIFLEGSRGINSLLENMCCISIMFREITSRILTLKMP